MQVSDKVYDEMYAVAEQRRGDGSTTLVTFYTPSTFNRAPCSTHGWAYDLDGTAVKSYLISSKLEES